MPSELEQVAIAAVGAALKRLEEVDCDCPACVDRQARLVQAMELLQGAASVVDITQSGRH